VREKEVRIEVPETRLVSDRRRGSGSGHSLLLQSAHIDPSLGMSRIIRRGSLQLRSSPKASTSPHFWIAPKRGRSRQCNVSNSTRCSCQLFGMGLFRMSSVYLLDVCSALYPDKAHYHPTFGCTRLRWYPDDAEGQASFLCALVMDSWRRLLSVHTQPGPLTSFVSEHPSVGDGRLVLHC
jgi:hypothetical protein